MTCGCNNLGLKEQLAEVASVNAALTAKLAAVDSRIHQWAREPYDGQTDLRACRDIKAIIDGTQA